ncbi:MAG: electron transport complex subunit E [Pseudomonadota bacterium]
MKLLKDFTKGLWKEIPPFRLVLGLCPTLAVTKSAETGLGMGIAVIFVLTCSNILVSSLRNIIPRKVRIASFIVIIATFVVMVELASQAYFYKIYESLGIFIPLIVVNCIILGRAEAFASRNGIVASALDGLGIGVGYTLSLTVLGAIREILGQGTFFGASIMWSSFRPFTFMVEAPGAFLSLGILLAVMNSISKSRQ